MYVRKLEAGRSDMTIGVLERLAKALGVKPGWLLDLTEATPRRGRRRG